MIGTRIRNCEFNLQKMQSDKKQLNFFTNVWFVVLLITLAAASAFFWWGCIQTPDLGPIQFSGTSTTLVSLMKDAITTIRPNIYYDFIFILIYSLLFYLAYRVFQISMRIPVARFWIVLCLLPGLLDVTENCLLLLLLNDAENSLLFNTFWLVVRAKWTLIIPFSLINFTILVYYVISSVNSLFS